MDRVKPYYEVDGITIYHGDCCELIQTVAPPHPYVLITDPPYGVGKAAWDTYPSGSLEEAWRGAVAALVFWSAFDLSGPAATFSGDALKNTIVWWKPNLPVLWMWDRARLASQWEPIFYHARPGFEPAERPTDVWSFNYPANSSARWHPTQKPLPLMRRCVRLLGDNVVVDPFAGSGTTLEAARDEGRCAVGIEIEERYCEIAAERLSQGVLAL